MIGENIEMMMTCDAVGLRSLPESSFNAFSPGAGKRKRRRKSVWSRLVSYETREKCSVVMLIFSVFLLSSLVSAVQGSRDDRRIRRQHDVYNGDYYRYIQNIRERDRERGKTFKIKFCGLVI